MDDARSQYAALASSLCSDVAGSGAGLCVAAGQLVGGHLRFDAADPAWADRDRVLAEPACAGLARALERRLGSPGQFAVQAQAFEAGVGQALAERMLAARYGRSLVDHRVWVLCTADRLANGAVQEAAWLAGAWRLGRLAVLAAGEAEEPAGVAGIAAGGWTVRRVAAGDAGAVESALSAALRSYKPTLVLCVGEAAAPVDGDAAGADALWQAAGSRRAGARRGWLKRLARHSGRAGFVTALSGRPAVGWHTALLEAGPKPAGAAVSTLATVRGALAGLGAVLPDLAVLPGDPALPALAGQSEPPAALSRAAGRLALGMGGAQLGAALHGGVLAVAAQPAANCDQVVPGLRAAALAQARLIQVLLEPEVAGGEVVPRAGLAAMRNLLVFRPADRTEALECLELAVGRAAGPSVMLVSDVAVPVLAEAPSRTRSARGGYVVAEARGVRGVTLVASGRELHVALGVRAGLSQCGVEAAVVSLVCWELFALQEEGWREAVLGAALRVGVECGGAFGWERWLGEAGVFVAPEGEAMEGQMRFVRDAVLRHLGRPPAGQARAG